MPELSFEVESAEPVTFAASPMLAFKLRIRDAVADAPSLIHSIALRCQVRIEPTRRSYSRASQERLRDLFGEPDRWSQTVRSMLWTHTSVVVPHFTGTTVVDLPVPCTFDFNVAATKYFAGLADGEVPLCLLFSGTIFYDDHGLMQVAQIPWENEAAFRLPVRVWKEMMDHYYPASAWLCLARDVFDQLERFKVQHGLPTWEHAFERLLASANEQVAP
jgi:hypothetical protein